MNAAVIVAAGRGTRMGPGRDKLFLELAGEPAVVHTWRAFDRCGDVDEVILVVRPGMEGEFRALADLVRPVRPWRCVAGGAERQDSVANGLGAIGPDTELVAIQDGARPCTSPELIRRCLAAARARGASVAAQRAVDTVKESDGGTLIARHLDRSRLWLVQTPQCFRVEVLRRALAAVRASGRQLTDDTAACEWIGQPVELVEAAEPNPKLTVPADVPYLEMLLRQLAAAPGEKTTGAAA